MQTTVFAGYLNVISIAIRLDELLKYLGKLTNVPYSDERLASGEKEQFIQDIFRAREGYTLLRENPLYKELLSDLGLSTLFDPNGLARLLTAITISETTSSLRGNHVVYTELCQMLGYLRAFVSFRNTIFKQILRPRTGDVQPSEIFELEVADFDNSGISINRFNRITCNVRTLYDVLARILESTMPIKIAYLDSGSNALIAFKGDGKVIQALTNAFKQLWHIVRFHKLDGFDRKLESVGKALDILEVIREKQNSGALDAETAKNLQFQIGDQLVSIIESGALPKVIEVEAKVPTMQLLSDKQDIKLIGDASDNPPPAGAT